MTNNATNENALPNINPRILHALWFTPMPDGFWGMPIFKWGPPGIGKTFGVKAAAKRAGLPLVRLAPSEAGEGQFGVVPMPEKGADGVTRLTYPAPDWADTLDEGGVLFVDEFNLGGMHLQPPMLGLVQLRKIGNTELDKCTRVIAAANEPHDAPGAVETAASVGNRFAHFNCAPLPVDDWALALARGFRPMADGTVAEFDPRKEEARVNAAWAEAYGRAAATVGAFVTRRPDLFLVEEKGGRRKKALVRPTPRTWEYAARALASADIHGLDEADTDAMLSAIIGHDTVVEFAAWRADLDLPEPSAVLDGKVKWSHDSARPDRTDVVLRSLAAFLDGLSADDSTRIPRAEKAWAIIGDVYDEAADLARAGAMGLGAARLTFPRVKSPTARKVQAKMKDVVDAMKAALGE